MRGQTIFPSLEKVKHSNRLIYTMMISERRSGRQKELTMTFAATMCCGDNVEFEAVAVFLYSNL